MRISLEWLQTYFEEPLPATKDLANLIEVHSFEVEGIEGDAIDIGVLPNRAHDCLGYNGIAAEIAAITGLSPKPPENINERPLVNVSERFSSKIECAIEDSRCIRFTAAEIRGVSPKPSPALWAKRLAVHDSRAINAVVDATNMAMLETNQPTHAFDADKIQGKVAVRGAKAGERVVTLDGKDIELEEGALVIADDAGPLDLAGIKGGSRAGISESTNRILLTSCNFNAPAIRKSSQRHNVRTDASKRFEGELAPELAMRGLESALRYLAEGAAGKDFSASERIDVWPRPTRPFRTGLSCRECSALLGYDVTEVEIADKLKLIGCEVETGVNPQERIVEVVIAALGKPYVYGASTRFDAPDEFDCSSLVAYACSLAGLSSPRISIDQFGWSERVGADDLQPGDLVFSQIDGRDAPKPPRYATVEFLPDTPIDQLGAPAEMGIDHVGIYIGNGEVLHATMRGGGFVKREPLAGSGQFKNIVGYGRVSPLGETRVVATVPPERPDLRWPEDLIEEVGRLLGYERVPETPTPDWGATGEGSAEFRLGQAIRAALVGAGFSEVMTSSFAVIGDLKVLRPQNEEKPFLRTSLATGAQAALERAALERAWLGQDYIWIFEIGHVFSGEGKESLRLLIGGIQPADEKRYPLRSPRATGHGLVLEALGEEAADAMSEVAHGDIEISNATGGSFVGNWVELSLDAALAVPISVPFPLPPSATTRYQPLSPYPYAIRDVAVWVPDEGGEREKVADVIRAAAGSLLVKLYCFDEFTKPGKDGAPTHTSYAFRLILQASDRTLSDTEIAAATDAAYAALRGKGWEIR